MDRNDAFLFAECEYLRMEIAELGTESRSLARYALTITGAIYGWIVVRLLDPKVAGLNLQFKILARVLAALILVFGIHSLALTHGIKRNAAYVRMVEKALELLNGLGWKSHLKRTRTRFIFWSIVVYWAVLFLATLVIPFLLPFGL